MRLPDPLQRWIARLRDLAGLGSDEEAWPDETVAGPSGRLPIGEETPPRLDDAASDEGGLSLDRAKREAAEWAERGAGAARELANRAGDRIRTAWEPEDQEAILRESPLFEPVPADPDEVEPELLSLRWRSEAMLALSTAGLLSLEDEIIHHTDRLFHSGLPTPELSQRLFGKDLGEIHRWIDTVPGSSVPGGGITHRVEHGHDAAAAAEIYREHGLEGLLAWTQHVGQDVFSITGVPVPVGGQATAEYLVDNGHTTSGKAALLVSFNAVELAASFLAGAFALRLAMLLKDAHRRRKVKERCEAALEARERGDIDAVIAHYAEARSLEDDPTLSLALGWAYRETGRPAAESFLAFRRAALELATEDRTIEVDGVALSLRGLAYLLALVEAPRVLEREDLAGAWREELERMTRGAVASFEAAAIAQSERPAFSVGDRELEWRPRPLSAATNYYLAGRAAMAVPFASPTSEVPRLRGNAVELLGDTREEAASEEADRIESAARRWRRELAAEVGLSPAS